MSIFQYRAKKASGETISGQIEAQNQEAAIDLLSQRGLLPIALEEKNTLASSQGGQIKPRKISSKEIYYFSQQLSSLMKAGIPILRALSLISRQLTNPYFKYAIEDIERQIKDGQTLSNCLLNYPKIFNPFYVAMVHTGEESGNLREILERVSRYQKNQEEIASKVRSALAYPLLMAAVGIGTVIFILTFVMPRVTSLFTSVNQELPLPTQILIAISTFMRNAWPWILLTLVALAFFVARWRESSVGRAALSRLKLKVPLYGSFILKAELAKFCRALALLLHSGIPLIKGIRIAVPILDNQTIQKELAACEKDLEAGGSLGSSLKKAGYIPEMMTNLLLIGEESGTFEEVLNDIADSYDQETNETIKTLTTLLEPIMILTIGLIIGFIVIAMLLPIFQIDIAAQ